MQASSVWPGDTPVAEIIPKPSGYTICVQTVPGPARSRVYRPAGQESGEIYIQQSPVSAAIHPGYRQVQHVCKAQLQVAEETAPATGRYLQGMG
jgi:hypothetical protein